MMTQVREVEPRKFCSLKLLIKPCDREGHFARFGFAPLGKDAIQGPGWTLPGATSFFPKQDII
jgi:hypothetical protein